MKIRALVVDNNAVVRSLITAMLARTGHEVVAEADSVDEGLKAFKEHKPNLITLDLSLSEGNGLDFLKKLRELDEKIKVLVISANAQPAIIEEVLGAGADDYLVKPFVYVDFQKAIEGCFPK